MASTYNSMLAQQQAIESALRSEIAADQVEIQQLQNGIRVRMSSDLLYSSGSTELTPAGRAALDKVAPQLAQSAAQSGRRSGSPPSSDAVPARAARPGPGRDG